MTKQEKKRDDKKKKYEKETFRKSSYNFTSMKMQINRYQRQHNRSEINWFLVEENIVARDYSRGRQ